MFARTSTALLLRRPRRSAFTRGFSTRLKHAPLHSSGFVIVGDLAGFLGTICLSACALPLVVQTVSTGHTSVDPLFLGLWLAGELLMLAHVLAAGATLPVKLNYIANSIMVGVIGCYRWL